MICLTNSKSTLTTTINQLQHRTQLQALLLLTVLLDQPLLQHRTQLQAQQHLILPQHCKQLQHHQRTQLQARQL
jgi:hypothetical protein